MIVQSTEIETMSKRDIHIHILDIERERANYSFVDKIDWKLETGECSQKTKAVQSANVVMDFASFARAVAIC
jgi:hypothetical protein